MSQSRLFVLPTSPTSPRPHVASEHPYTTTIIIPCLPPSSSSSCVDHALHRFRVMCVCVVQLVQLAPRVRVRTRALVQVRPRAVACAHHTHTLTPSSPSAPPIPHHTTPHTYATPAFVLSPVVVRGGLTQLVTLALVLALALALASSRLVDLIAQLSIALPPQHTPSNKLVSEENTWGEALSSPIPSRDL